MDHDTSIAQGRLLILSGFPRGVLSAIQTQRADKSNAGRREPPDNESEDSFSSPEGQRLDHFRPIQMCRPSGLLS